MVASGSWWKILAQYDPTPPYSRFKGATVIPKNLTITDELQIQPLIADLLTRNILPPDENALYLFLGGFDTMPRQFTTQGQAYCSVFCMFGFLFLS
ncbi:hypothetical protein HDU98_010087 [Podochytrium sp. JEL0797]|nr:hypothetical protein HDU98_010087 [Podochytrium sp. JEL0797]